MSKDTVHRNRLSIAAKSAEKIRKNFVVSTPLILHFDGKKVCENTSDEKVERIGVSVSGEGVDQFLGASEAKSGTSVDVSDAVMKCVNYSGWDIYNFIIGLCYDTTSVNTGCKNGAAILLERKFNKDLLQFPCRHHIFEVLLSEAYYVCFGKSKEPDLSFFKDFKKSWDNLDKTNIFIPNLLTEKDAQSLANFVIKQIKLKKQARDDYLEFLNLLLIHCNHSNFVDTYMFKKPGCISNARWMAKAIYALKMSLFQKEYKIPEDHVYSLNIFCKFILRFYAKAWYTSRIAAVAPLTDLNLIKELYNHKSQNLKELLLNIVINNVINKYINHMWYLNEELICLSLFDTNYSDENKSCLARCILNPNNNSLGSRKPKISNKDIPNIELTDFVTVNSVKFFDKLQVGHGFLATDPKFWHNDNDYKKAYTLVKSIHVANDTAERAVSTVTNYCNCITKSEESKQNLFPTVPETLKKFPRCAKKLLL